MGEVSVEKKMEAEITTDISAQMRSTAHKSESFMVPPRYASVHRNIVDVAA
jgi:hypothetical protein